MTAGTSSSGTGNTIGNGTMRQLVAADGHRFHAWENLPPTGGPIRKGIIVLQEIFGLTHYIRTVCATLAEQGYHVLAPALFDRVAPNTILPYDDTGIKDGLALRERLPEQGPEQDIAACITALRSTPNITHIGIIGFCWGGFLAWKAAQDLDIDAAVGWYGAGIAEACTPLPKCPVELHFGANDPWIPASDLEKIRTSCPNVSLHVYEGADHGFGCTERNSFNPAASTLAWQRSLTFFDNALK